MSNVLQFKNLMAQSGELSEFAIDLLAEAHSSESDNFEPAHYCIISTGYSACGGGGAWSKHDESDPDSLTQYIGELQMEIFRASQVLLKAEKAKKYEECEDKDEAVNTPENMLSTGDICKKLGFNVSAKYIEEELCVEPDFKTRVGTYWTKEKYQHICYELMQICAGEAHKDSE